MDREKAIEMVGKQSQKIEDCKKIKHNNKPYNIKKRKSQIGRKKEYMEMRKKDKNKNKRKNLKEKKGYITIENKQNM